MGNVIRGGLRELVVRPSSQMPGLDGLRAIAVLLVIGSHFVINAYPQAHGPETSLVSNPLFTYGWTGVDLFFILSGFLIGRQLWRELQTTQTIRIGRFLMRRGLRIWPLYYFTIATLWIMGTRIRASDWLFFSNYKYGGLSRGWSLSTEEQFYIALPLLLILIGRRIPFRRLPWLLIGSAAATLVVRAFVVQRNIARHIPYAKADYSLIYPIHVHADALLLGALIALVSVLRPAWFKRTPADGFSRAGFAIMVGATAVALALHWINRELFAFLSLALIFGGVALFVLLDHSMLSRPLKSWLFYPISRLSYGMYLNHFLFAPSVVGLAVAALMRVTTSPTLIFFGSLLAGTIASFVIAAGTFVLIEHPFLLLRDRVFHEHRTERPAGAPRDHASETPAVPGPVTVPEIV